MTSIVSAALRAPLADGVKPIVHVVLELAPSDAPVAVTAVTDVAAATTMFEAGLATVVSALVLIVKSVLA